MQPPKLVTCHTVAPSDMPNRLASVSELHGFLLESDIPKAFWRGKYMKNLGKVEA